MLNIFNGYVFLTYFGFVKIPEKQIILVLKH